MLQEVRMAWVLDAIGLHQAGRLSCAEAAELLGMSERHFRRLRDAYEAEGTEGLVDRRRGRVSGRRAGVDEIAWVVEEFGTRYFDFTAKHFHEAIHGRAMSDGRRFRRGYTWTKSVLQLRGLTTKPSGSRRGLRLRHRPQPSVRRRQQARGAPRDRDVPGPQRRRFRRRRGRGDAHHPWAR